MKSRYDGIQNYIMHADESCFFLTLLSIAEEELERLRKYSRVDFLDAVRHCMDKGWLKNDFTVLNDCRILEWLTGKKVTKRVVDKCGVLKVNEYSLEKWYNPRTEYNHFKRRYFDVFHDGITVKEGYIMCYYIYTID